MDETPPEKELEHDVGEFDRRLSDLEDHIDESRDKAEAARLAGSDRDDDESTGKQLPSQVDGDQEG